MRLRNLLRAGDHEPVCLTEGQRPQHREEREDPGDHDPGDAPTRARCDPADAVTDGHPDEKEDRDYDHALALVAGDLVIHRLHYATAEGAENRRADQIKPA